jgi:hypothetical protein
MKAAHILGIAVLIAGCSSGATQAMPDAGCPTGEVLRYPQGCRDAGAPSCQPVGGSCGAAYCGCDGQTFHDSCSGASHPYAYKFLQSVPVPEMCDPGAGGGQGLRLTGGGGMGGQKTRDGAPE